MKWCEFILELLKTAKYQDDDLLDHKQTDSYEIDRVTSLLIIEINKIKTKTIRELLYSEAIDRINKEYEKIKQEKIKIEKQNNQILIADKQKLITEDLIFELNDNYSNDNPNDNPNPLFEITKDLITLNRWNSSQIPIMPSIETYNTWKETAKQRDIQNAEEIKEILIRETDQWNKDFPPPIPPPLMDRMIETRKIIEDRIMRDYYRLKNNKLYLTYQKDYFMIKNLLKRWGHFIHYLPDKYKSDVELCRIAMLGEYGSWITYECFLGDARDYFKNIYEFERKWHSEKMPDF
jgi:hypothetical protein